MEKIKKKRNRNEYKITYIYYLHKGDNIPFYVGKSNNPVSRRNEHVFKEIIPSRECFCIIDECDIKYWNFWEKWYISLFKSWGFDLVNKNNGGGGPSFHKEESKQQISNSLQGKNHTHETKMKMSESAKGRKNTDIQKEKLSKSLQIFYSNNPGSFTGKKHTKESIDKIMRPICAFKDDILVEEYPSLKEAGLAHKSHSGNIIKYMKENKPYHGMIWKYKFEK